MNKCHTSVATTLAVFTVSHLLPAFGMKRGFDCIRVSFERLVSIPERLHDVGVWLYFGCFAISNLLFVTFTLMCLAGHRVSRFMSIILLLMCLHVSSWFLINLSHLADIKLGYYLWWAAYIGLYATFLAAARESHRKPPHHHHHHSTPKMA